MTPSQAILDPRNVSEAVQHLREAAAAKKCWQCGCLRNSLRAIGEAFPASRCPAELDEVVQQARARMAEEKYDCLGCEVCFPAVAVNALGVEGEACSAKPPAQREGWPPLPGSYNVLRWQAPVAVCTLTDESLAKSIAASAGPEVAIVGTIQTENLGIERLIQNTLANPNIRFLIVCGADSRQSIGHLPGGSLVALAKAGVDEQMRVLGAPGQRPVLRNLHREAVEHFRKTVQVLELIGVNEAPHVLDTVKTTALRNPGPAQPFPGARSVVMVRGHLPERTTPDPAGYFVVFLDHRRGMLSLEHYRNDGVLDVVIEGTSAAEVYLPALERGLVSRLDHAAYLGKELARAEHSLRSGEQYKQEAAPETSASVWAPACIPGKCNCH
jgi:tetrahydromethanopterin S-methyltransferase subunit A